MSYIATLASCLLGRIQPNCDFITLKGSSHGANQHFPIELFSSSIQGDLNIQDWKRWHAKVLEEYGRNGICVVKDGWVKLGRDKWEYCVNSTDSIAVVSNCDTPLDWLYAWFNMVDKIPKHIYYRLRQRSILYPKLWNRLGKRKKIVELKNAMPIYPLGDTPKFNVPTLDLPATKILEQDFPSHLSDFLDSQGMKSLVTTEISKLHDTFVSKQQINFMKAKSILKGDRWEPNGPYDEILFSWLDQRGAMGLYSSPSSLSYQSGHGMVPSNALSRSVG